MQDFYKPWTAVFPKEVENGTTLDIYIFIDICIVLELRRVGLNIHISSGYR